MFITYGDAFLATPSSYDELYYDLIRTYNVYENLYTLGRVLHCFVCLKFKTFDKPFSCYVALMQRIGYWSISLVLVCDIEELMIAIDQPILLTKYLYRLVCKQVCNSYNHYMTMVSHDVSWRLADVNTHVLGFLVCISMLFL
mgnify:FL=1